jgi:hypothetical protein
VCYTRAPAPARGGGGGGPLRWAEADSTAAGCDAGAGAGAGEVVGSLRLDGGRGSGGLRCGRAGGVAEGCPSICGSAPGAEDEEEEEEEEGLSAVAEVGDGRAATVPCLVVALASADEEVAGKEMATEVGAAEAEAEGVGAASLDGGGPQNKQHANSRFRPPKMMAKSDAKNERVVNKSHRPLLWPHKS